MFYNALLKGNYNDILLIAANIARTDESGITAFSQRLAALKDIGILNGTAVSRHVETVRSALLQAKFMPLRAKGKYNWWRAYQSDIWWGCLWCLNLHAASPQTLRQWQGHKEIHCAYDNSSGKCHQYGPDLSPTVPVLIAANARCNKSFVGAQWDFHCQLFSPETTSAKLWHLHNAYG